MSAAAELLAAERWGDRPSKAHALERLEGMADQLEGERRRAERRAFDRGGDDRRG